MQIDPEIEIRWLVVLTILAAILTIVVFLWPKMPW